MNKLKTKMDKAKELGGKAKDIGKKGFANVKDRLKKRLHDSGSEDEGEAADDVEPLSRPHVEEKTVEVEEEEEPSDDLDNLPGTVNAEDSNSLRVATVASKSDTGEYAGLTDEERKAKKRAKVLSKGVKVAAQAYAGAERIKENVKTVVVGAALSTGEAAQKAYKTNVSEETRDKISGKATAAKSKGKRVLKQGANLAGEALEATKEGKKKVDTAMAAAFEELPEDQKKFLKDRKQYVNDKIDQAKGQALDLADPVVDRALLTVKRLAVRKATQDPFLPSSLKGTIVSTADSVWPDFAAEIKLELHKAVRKKTEPHAGQRPCCACRPRAFFLHHWLPYDRSFFGKIHDPVFYPLYLMTLIPYYGVRAFFYALLFLCIDKRDEYQLILYIQSFKASQFLAGGVVSGLLGLVRLYSCLNFSARDMCDDFGPGVTASLWWDILSYFVQIVLVWLAYFLLPCSIQKGRTKFAQNTKSERRQREADESKAREGCCRLWCQGLSGCLFCCFGCCRGSFEDDKDDEASIKKRAVNARLYRGRRLGCLLCYDFLVLLVLGGLLAFATWFKLQDGEVLSIYSTWSEVVASPTFKTDVFFFKWAVSLLSLPFFIVNLPGLSLLISHAKATGYNRNGVIQPKISPILSEAGKRRLARALERQKQHPDSKDGKEGEKKREKKTQPKKDAKKKAPKDHVELSSVNVQ